MKQLGVLMDDFSKIHPQKDSTLAMMREANNRGWDIYTFDANDISHLNHQTQVNAKKISMKPSKDPWCEVLSYESISLEDLDVILMRKDPPFNMDYIYATYMLDHAKKSGVLVVNDPQSIRDCNEKLFALNFPNCIPKTLVTSNIDEINQFIADQKTCVIKPLDGMGGKDIYKVSHGETEIRKIVDRLTHHFLTPIMLQEYLEDIKHGDKRILLIDGEPIDYALARIPAENDFRGNLAQGASGVAQELSERDRWLCQQISPTLKEKGLMFVGLDVIGDYVTEINVTSPTCIVEIDKAYDTNIAGVLFDAIEKKLSGE
ncbi:MAG: glutathione synthase [Gammaproteobacteria bacterium]